MPGTLSALEFREALRTNGNAEEPIIAETGKQANSRAGINPAPTYPEKRRL